jgi:hypothetical protein
MWHMKKNGFDNEWSWEEKGYFFLIQKEQMDIRKALKHFLYKEQNHQNIYSLNK